MQVEKHKFEILVVDDDANEVRAVREGLNPSGFRVRTATSPAQARAQLSPQFDAVIIGGGMGHAVMEEVTREIAQLGLPSGIVLALQSRHHQATRLARRWRIEGVVMRPYDVSNLIEIVGLAAMVGQCRKKPTPTFPTYSRWSAWSVTL